MVISRPGKISTLSSRSQTPVGMTDARVIVESIIKEFRFAGDAPSLRGLYPPHARSHRTAENATSGCQAAMLYTLQAVLGPLVRVSDSKVALVHQSAKEFILHRVGSDDGVLPLAIRAIHTEGCALAIASACVKYLLLDDFAEDFFGPNNSPTLTASDASGSYERSPLSTSARLILGRRRRGP